MTGCVAKRKYGLPVLDDTPRPAHIQRCTYTEVRGKRHWQCLQADPHPSGQGHQFPIDARFGQPLHEMHPEKLAALLRDHVALVDNLQRRVDELQATAIDLAGLATGTPALAATEKWMRATSPGTAQVLDRMHPEGWSLA